MQPALTAQDEIIDEFALFSDWSERYQYIIDLGKKLAPFPDTLKTDEHLVSGCQSKVWLVAEGDADCLRFSASSDSTIVSGLICLLLRVYSGHSADTILETTPYFIEKIGLQAHLSGTRSNGLHAVLAKIKSFAQTKISDYSISKSKV
jgi:cysteine desulfuration protein SufE